MPVGTIGTDRSAGGSFGSGVDRGRSSPRGGGLSAQRSTSGVADAFGRTRDGPLSSNQAARAYADRAFRTGGGVTSGGPVGEAVLRGLARQHDPLGSQGMLGKIADALSFGGPIGSLLGGPLVGAGLGGIGLVARALDRNPTVARDDRLYGGGRSFGSRGAPGTGGTRGDDPFLRRRSSGIPNFENNPGGGFNLPGGGGGGGSGGDDTPAPPGVGPARDWWGGSGEPSLSTTGLSADIANALNPGVSNAALPPPAVAPAAAGWTAEGAQLPPELQQQLLLLLSGLGNPHQQVLG